MKYKLINRKKYRNIGRPRKCDYIYYKTFPKFMSALMGAPVNPKLPYPLNIIKVLIKGY